MNAPISTHRIRRTHGFSFAPEQEKRGQMLLFAGWAVLLLYFPSGMLHYYLGGKVYLRDGLMGLHFVVSLYFLFRTGLLWRLLRHVWWLAIPPLLLLPAAANREFTIETVTFVKWMVLWIDWTILGLLLATVRPPAGLLAIFGVLTIVLVTADGLCGLAEFETKKFLFSMNGEKSALGVTLGADQMLGGKPRVKGLQRDVFSFANLMAASAVAGLAWASITSRPAWRIIGWVAAAFFAAMLFVSGGRSAFFGVAAAIVVAIVLQWAPEVAHRYKKLAISIWLLMALGISLYGVGPLTQSVSDLFLKGNRAGDWRSAFMRDANWEGITTTIRDVPVVLLAGAPVAALADPHVTAIYHWADNEYLWLFYHVGVPGALAMFFFFYGALRHEKSSDWASTTLLLFLFFIMGEGIARESLTFLGCFPLFIAIGAVIAPNLSRRTEAEEALHGVGSR